MTAALEGDEWSAVRPGRTLPPGKTRYPLHSRLGGPQGRSGRAENLVPTGIRSRTVQPGSSVAIPTELPGPRTCTYYTPKFFKINFNIFFSLVCLQADLYATKFFQPNCLSIYALYLRLPLQNASLSYKFN